MAHRIKVMMAHRIKAMMAHRIKVMMAHRIKARQFFIFTPTISSFSTEPRKCIILIELRYEKLDSADSRSSIGFVKKALVGSRFLWCEMSTLFAYQLRYQAPLTIEIKVKKHGETDRNDIETEI